MRTPIILSLGIVGLLSALVSACQTSRKDAPPSDSVTHLPGYEQGVTLRYSLDRDPDLDAFVEEAQRVLRRENEHLRTQNREKGPAHILVLSGGGDNGAFGAGLLNGWKKQERPTFNVVTGISTGALIAPFAFLGSKYDKEIAHFYKNTSSDDVFTLNSKIFTVIANGESFADTSPLRKRIEATITPSFVNEIADEYKKGRALLIGTVNLDTAQPIVWNMGLIACNPKQYKNHPIELKCGKHRSQSSPNVTLFREILLAAAAIPGAFPPVMIDVNSDSQAYQEMHVDGGAYNQSFAYPRIINAYKLHKSDQGKVRPTYMWIIQNARLGLSEQTVNRTALDIAFRAISSLINSERIGELSQIKEITVRDRICFNLAYIGGDFDIIHDDEHEFDPKYMNALFDYGYKKSRNNDPTLWNHKPPRWGGSKYPDEEYCRKS